MRGKNGWDMPNRYFLKNAGGEEEKKKLMNIVAAAEWNVSGTRRDSAGSG